jgi:hypothetical protein
VSDFCRNHDLKLSVLQRHLKRRRLSKVESREVKRLVPVAIGGNETARRHAKRMRFGGGVIQGGRRIQMRADFDLGTLERLLNVFEPQNRHCTRDPIQKPVFRVGIRPFTKGMSERKTSTIGLIDTRIETPGILGAYPTMEGPLSQLTPLFSLRNGHTPARRSSR